jgi:hypothetical protein
VNIVVVGYFPPGYKMAPYFDWRDAFLGMRPTHAVRVVNTSPPIRIPDRYWERIPFRLFDVGPVRRAYAGDLPCDLLVYLPGFFYFHRGRHRRVFEEAAASRRARFAIAFFLENEYRFLAEKVDFARAMGADVLVSALPLDVAEPFYRSRFPGKVVSLPFGFNPHIFRPLRPLRERPIDIGTRSHIYPSGNPIGEARNTLLRMIAAREGPFGGFTIDVSLDQLLRFTREDWSAFLNRCKATVASEGAGRLSWGEDPSSGSFVGAISSRHFEAMGTGTAQVLLEGRYHDVLRPREHYIPVRRDLSNLDEVAAALRDLAGLERMAAAARELALSAHTYDHRVRELVRLI